MKELQKNRATLRSDPTLAAAYTMNGEPCGVPLLSHQTKNLMIGEKFFLTRFWPLLFVHHCNFISIDGDSYRTRERIGVIRTGKRGRPRKVTDDEENTIDEQEGDTVI